MRLGTFTLLLASMLSTAAQVQAATPQFAARVSIPTGLQQLQDVVAADFNGDGKIDLAVCDRKDRKILVYLNSGAGTLGLPVVTTLTLGGTTGALVAGDVNEDGKQDLIVGTISGGDQQDLLLLGNGDGTFTQKGMLPGSYGFQKGQLVDLNGDHHLDFVTADNGNVASFLGDGKGGFTPVAIPAQGTPSLFLSVAVADFNRDSKPDFIVGAYQTNDLRFFPGNGDGSFQAPTSFSAIANEAPDYLAAGDLNGDGRPDLVFSVPNVAVLLFGNGDGTFQTASNQIVYLPTATANTPSSVDMAPPVALADMDKDGTIDAVVIDPDTSTVNVDLNTDGTGHFPSGPNFSAAVPMGSSQLQLADLNGDGLPDIISTSYQTNEISIFLSILPKSTPVATLTDGGSSALAGTPVTVVAKLAGTPVPTGTVTLYDAATALSTQTLDGSGQATFANVMLSTGAHSLSVTYSGDTRYNALAASAAAGAFTQHIVDVSVALPMPSQTISSGASASYPVVLTPTSDFTGTVVLVCTGLPVGFSCPSVMATGNTATLVVTPPSTVASAIQVTHAPGLQLACLIAGLCLLPVAGRRRALSLLSLFFFAGIFVLTGCSNSSPAAPKRYTGTTTFTVTATVTQGSSSVTRSSPATLIVQ